jgi:site-specific DNA recombinase
MGYLGYIRVSRTDGRAGESFQSPDEQRRRIEGWAQSRGFQIADWEEDLDVSGGDLKRPGLDQILAAIKTGSADGIVVAKLDRLSRLGVADALKLVEQIHADGGKVADVESGLDPETPTGEFGMTIMLALARMERRRLTDSWISARTNAVKRGAFVGPTPLGFERGDGSRLVPDENAPNVRRLFEISGEGGLDLAFDFFRETWPQRFASRAVLRKLLASRVYRGDIQSGDIIAREVIDPLVSEDVWYAAQHEAPPVRKSSLEYPLSGIARCAACGGPMVGHHPGKPGSKKRGYRCNGKNCTERPHVYAEPLEEIIGEAIKRTAHRWVGASPDEMAELEAAKQEAQAQLEFYVTTVKITDGDLWQKGLDARQDAFAEAQQAYAAARNADFAMPDLDSPTAEDLRRMIDTLTVRQRKGKDDPLAKRVKLTLVGD